jgi:arabinogalactan oligomer/maltooligosaccharide transport system permease protein
MNNVSITTANKTAAPKKASLGIAHKKGTIISHIILSIAAIWSVFPIVWIVCTSFKPREEVFSTTIQFIPHHPTLNNYLYLLTNKDGMFLSWFLNSILIALVATAIGVFLAATAAYAFSRFKFPGKKSLVFSFLLAQMFPGALLVVPLYSVMKAYGLLNK